MFKTGSIVECVDEGSNSWDAKFAKLNGLKNGQLYKVVDVESDDMGTFFTLIPIEINEHTCKLNNTFINAKRFVLVA